MASVSTNQFKSGLKFMLDGDPCSIIENELVKPGKGQAFNRVKFRNLKTGRVNERTFKSGESVESADVVDTVITNALIIDHWGIIKADVGLKNGRIHAIGKAGNPDIQPAITIAVGAGTEVIAGEGMILTAGGIIVQQDKFNKSNTNSPTYQNLLDSRNESYIKIKFK